MLLRQSNSTAGAEKLGEVQQAAQALTEALGLLAGLDRAGTLPAGSRANLVSYGNDLAKVKAKLVGLRAATR
jgi:hypothetical protein